MIIVCLTTAVNTTAIWCHPLRVVRLRRLDAGRLLSVLRGDQRRSLQMPCAGDSGVFPSSSVVDVTRWG